VANISDANKRKNSKRGKQELNRQLSKGIQYSVSEEQLETVNFWKNINKTIYQVSQFFKVPWQCPHTFGFFCHLSSPLLPMNLA
jgi:hypothetical protein